MRASLLVLMLCLLSACSASIDDVTTFEPEFDLFGYFEGEVDAYGMVQDGSGLMIRHFNVVISGEVNGDTLVLSEDFVFDDGEKQQRIWTITKLGDHRFSGKASDVVGEASGVIKGNTLNWRYVLSMEVDGSHYDINFDDWMFALDDKRVFNKASMSKWGIDVGTVTLFFEKR